MKTYKHLWEDFISDDNIICAIKKSSLGKRKRKDVKYYFDDIENSIPRVREKAEHYRNTRHKPKQISEIMTGGKTNVV